MEPLEAERLAERLLAKDRDAVAPALNLIDDRRPASRLAAERLLEILDLRGDGGALRVGVTGAPGAGKSTLLDALVRALRAEDRTVGIIAVDPSSQRSGGALLGDRLRMRSGARDGGVFVRSMAARDRLGGLADATQGSTAVLAAVFDTVFVETVGVGQSETEVARLVDTLVFVAQPAAGDTLQYMKAGLVELPDIFAVNKADLGAPAERTAAEVTAGLGLGETPSDGWSPPVLLVSARDDTGIDELLAAIRAHRTHLERGGLLDERRREGRAALLRDWLLQRYGHYGLAKLGGPDAVSRRLDATAGQSPWARLGPLCREIEDALRKAD
ncbi:MAG: methylmalonyl Co-A mutase-associated GTPase MeaB [Myxococcota bacterium]